MPAARESLDAGALFETYHKRIFCYILRLMRNRAEAEDLVQETFLRAYRRGESLRDPGAVRGWLYRIATHVCLDRLRQRQALVSIDHPEDADEAGIRRVETPISPSPSPLEITERKETSACVQRCLDFLPDQYRAVILLREAHCLTAEEMAELLGVPVTTVKMRLHRARRLLQQVMEQGCAVATDKCGVPDCRPKS